MLDVHSTRLCHQARYGAWGAVAGIVFALCCSCLLVTTLVAQDPAPAAPSLNLLDQLNPLGAPSIGGGEGDLVLVGRYRLAEGSGEGELTIEAGVAPGWHVYSITQLPGGPQKSKLTVAPSEQFRLLGPFVAEQPPRVKRYEFFDVPVEEHDGTVAWTAPIRLAANVLPHQVAFQVTFEGQICQDDGVCIPISARPVPVKFAGFYKPETVQGSFRGEGEHLTLAGDLSAGTVAAGQSVRLSLTGTPDRDFHIYAYAASDPDKLARPTLVVVALPEGWQAQPPQASAEPHREETGLEDDPVLLYHKQPVTWSVEIQVPAGTAPGVYRVAGAIGYQTCTDSSCDPPRGLRFDANLQVVAAGESAGDTPNVQPLAFRPVDYKVVAGWAAQVAAANPQPTADPAARPATGNAAGPGSDVASQPALDLTALQVDDGDDQAYSFGMILGIAFFGGLILNFMPCVLPVIGLKVMSFVQQAGESRSQILWLNIWYAAGLISVFLVLATLAAVLNMGWGEQFNFDLFNIVMVAVVFSMGLSFLGVWEIPIPGFVGTGKANEIASREGPVGAFAKGAVTTVLATPCSGPGLATALAWCTGKPPWLVYTVFAVMGLGMASPYLLIGAKPGLIRFIPKPGAWMDTFKQLMGFLLLGTVVYIFTFIQWGNLIPTLALLFGIWASCWWIGRLSYGATAGETARAWVAAVAFATLIGWFAFSDRFGVFGYETYGLKGMMDYRFASAVDSRVQEVIADADTGTSSTGVVVANVAKPANDFELPWQPFTTEKLTQLLQQNQTVLVDFTAKWCVTCKVLEQSVLNTRDVRTVVEANGVVPLIADWSDRGPEIGELMNSLGSKQVPVLAIFPAGRPNQPIVIRGGYTKGTLIDKLQQAGPSQTTSATTGQVAVETAAGGAG
jgi:suppressor for copper-sensitivity B